MNPCRLGGCHLHQGATILALVILAFFGTAACGDSSLATTQELVKRLDKHQLSGESVPLFVIVQAYDGRKYSVEPGGYRLEIYLYQDRGSVDHWAENVRRMDSNAQALTYRNALLILHTADSDASRLLLADLRDSEMQE